MPLSRRTALLAAAGAALARPAAAQDFPNRPLRLVVPYPPGGSTDVIGRIAAQRLGEVLGQSVVVDNRGGASGAVGSQAVARMPADGYALIVSGVGSHGVVPAINPAPGYDAVTDFTHVGMLGLFHSVLVVNPAFPATTLQGFLEEARRRPGAINYATSGSGSSNHLMGELIRLEAKVDIVHVPYRGAGPALQAVLANEVPAMCDSLPSAAGHIRAGTLRALAVSSRQRLPALPDVPTFTELGLPKIVVENWFGISAPAGLPAPVLARLSAALDTMLRQPDLVARFAEIGFDAQPMAPEPFAKFVAADVAFWTDAVRRSGVKP